MDNAAALFVDAPVEEGHADRTALVTPAGAVTYAALQRLTDRAAHALRARGVEPEQRVALLMADGPGWAATFFGRAQARRGGGPAQHPARAGRPPRPCWPTAGRGCWWPIGRCSRRAAIDGRAGARAVLDFDAAGARRARRGPLPAEPVGADAMAFWLYTSGTTGSPEGGGALSSHAARRPPLRSMLLGVTAADRVFATSKLFFAYALGNALLIPLLRPRDARISIRAGRIPPRWRGVMREFAPTLFFSVPTVYARLLRADLPAGHVPAPRASASRPGERLPADSTRPGGRASGSRSWTASGPPRPSSWCSPTGPGQSRPVPPACRCPAPRPASSTPRASPVADGEEGVLWVRTPVAGRGVLPAARPLAPDLRGRLVPDRRRLPARRRRPPRPLRPRGRLLQGGRAVGGAGEVESVLLRHPEVLDGGWWARRRRAG